MEAAGAVEEFEVEGDHRLAVEGAGGGGLHGHDGYIEEDYRSRNAAGSTIEAQAEILVEVLEMIQ